MLKKTIEAFSLKNLKGFLAPRVLAIGVLSMPIGLMFILIISTAQIWLKQAGVSKTLIGVCSLTFLPHALKFIWAPFIDQIKVPFLGKKIGRRRSWALIIQSALVLSLILLGASNPQENITLTIILMFVVNFLAASQEIIIDAYRIEVLTKTQFVPGSTLYVLGYRFGTIIGGAGALYMAEVFPWQFVFSTMALFVVLSLVTILANPEPALKSTEIAPSFKRVFNQKLPNFIKKDSFFYRGIFCPFLDFANRPHWFLILLIVLIYKLGDSMLANMANSFYLEIGFTITEIARVTKFFGIFPTILGGFIGGALVKKMGLTKGLLLCGIIHLSSNSMYIIQALVGAHINLLYIGIILENITGGMNTTAFIIYISSLCHFSYTGTQYAFLSSVWYLGTILAGIIAGFLADHIGWIPFFFTALLAAVPGLSLLLYIEKYKNFKLESSHG